VFPQQALHAVRVVLLVAAAQHFDVCKACLRPKVS
jgi:hypothetical protein